MAAPKIVWEPVKNSNLHDKQIIESLKTRLNDKIQKDSDWAKKAAIILEQWIKKTKP